MGNLRQKYTDEEWDSINQSIDKGLDVVEPNISSKGLDELIKDHECAVKQLEMVKDFMKMSEGTKETNEILSKMFGSSRKNNEVYNHYVRCANRVYNNYFKKWVMNNSENY